MSIYGELAALLTSVCWSLNSIFFSLAGKRVGSPAVNHMRIWLAFIVICVVHFILYGTVFPFDVSSDRLLYLAISGIIGFVIGDALLFESFVLIGPRLAMLLMLLAPVFSAFLAWIFLGEILLLIEIVGILVTMLGIAWVVAEKNNQMKINPQKNSHYKLGIFLGVGGAIGQAVGLLFSRMGLEGGFSAISANHIRVTIAAITMIILSLFQNKFTKYIAKMKDRKAFLHICGGTIMGPVLGVILSLVAIAHTHIGVASTLMSLSPILLLPMSYFFLKEKISYRAIFGTCLALIGVVLLFLK